VIFSYFFIHYNPYNNSLRNFKMIIPLLFRVINALLIVIVIQITPVIDQFWQYDYFEFALS
jgi:hypothetical protein